MIRLELRVTSSTPRLDARGDSISRHRLRRRLSETGRDAIIAVLSFMALPASAQEAPSTSEAKAAPALKVIEIEETEEVRALREGRADHPFAAISARSLHPEAAGTDRFLAAIDLSKLDSSVVGGSEGALAAVAAETVDTLEARTAYDAEGARATSFETRYDQLNATLQCHWSYDDTISARLAELDAKAREAELEQSFGAESSGQSAAPQNDTAAPPQDSDPEFDFILKERQFTKAGRPCLLTVTCESEKDFRCSEGFLDEMVKNVVLVREGAK